MEALSLDAGFEAGMGQLVLEIIVFGKDIFDAIDKELLGADDKNFVQPLFLEFAQRHPMFFQELDEMFAGNAPVLASGDAVAAEPAGIKPFTHRPRRDLADLRDLAGGKDFL